jgi:ribosomal protein L40E
VLLVVAMVAGTISVVAGSCVSIAGASPVPDDTPPPLAILIGAVNFILAWHTWHWRRWAVKATVAVQFLNACVLVAVGAPQFAVVRLVGLGLFVALVAPRWQYFEPRSGGLRDGREPGPATPIRTVPIPGRRDSEVAGARPVRTVPLSAPHSEPVPSGHSNEKGYGADRGHEAPAPMTRPAPFERRAAARRLSVAPSHQVCARCGAPDPADARFCAQCGNAMPHE